MVLKPPRPKVPQSRKGGPASLPSDLIRCWQRGFLPLDVRFYGCPWWFFLRFLSLMVVWIDTFSSKFQSPATVVYHVDI